MDGASHLLVGDADSGALYRIKLADGSAEKLADGLGAIAGLAWDHHGRLFISDGEGRRLLRHAAAWRESRSSWRKASATRPAFASTPPASACWSPTARRTSVTAVAVGVPGAEVDETPMPVETAVAFPDLQWAGWKGETDDGKPNPLRPIVLTHAGDGSNRVFVADEQGVVHVFPNDPKATKTKIFLDLRDRVVYDDKTNEEGFLGLAFHPKYKENGEFYVFYTTKKAKLTNVLSRFKVRKDDPDRADPASEEELLRVIRPYWNHDGGAVCFGPDGMLYLPHGDGGSGNDPYDNGQNRQLACWAKSYASTWTTRATASPTRSPRTIRSWAAPAPGRRYGLTACATSGGCRSTARPANSGRRTWARISLKRST